MIGSDAYVTVDEMARMKQLSHNWIRIILRSEVDLPDDQKRIPGAIKIGSGRRGEWYIPRSSAEAFEKTPRGRPREA